MSRSRGLLCQFGNARRTLSRPNCMQFKASSSTQHPRMPDYVWPSLLKSYKCLMRVYVVNEANDWMRTSGTVLKDNGTAMQHKLKAL